MMLGTSGVAAPTNQVSIYMCRQDLEADGYPGE